MSRIVSVLLWTLFLLWWAHKLSYVGHSADLPEEKTCYHVTSCGSSQHVTIWSFPYFAFRHTPSSFLLLWFERWEEVRWVQRCGMHINIITKTSARSTECHRCPTKLPQFTCVAAADSPRSIVWGGRCGGTLCWSCHEAAILHLSTSCLSCATWCIEYVHHSKQKQPLKLYTISETVRKHIVFCKKKSIIFRSHSQNLNVKQMDNTLRMRKSCLWSVQLFIWHGLVSESL